MSVSRSTSARATRSQLVAWVFYDWAHNSFGTIVQTFIFAAYFTRQIAPGEELGTIYWGNTIGLGGFLVALGGPVLGAIADRGGKRKRWIAVFTAICVTAMAGLFFIAPDQRLLWLALGLVLLGTIGSDFALIFYNAMLSDLVDRDRVGRLSGWGWAMGYAGGLACLTAVLFLFVQESTAIFPFDREAGMHIRAAMVFTALWFTAFALPMFLFTPDRPGTTASLRYAVREGVAQLRDSFRHLRRYAGILRFLLARMLYIDGPATLFSMGGVYAAGTFDMTGRQVLLFGISLNLSAGAGAACFAWVDDWIGGKRTIIIGLIGLIIPGVLMLTAGSITLFWLWGVVLGIFVGPVQTASRSYLSRAAPEELRTQFFGLYALSGKATAFVGPLLVAWLTAFSGSQRIGMSAVVMLFVLGLAVVSTVAHEK